MNLKSEICELSKYSNTLRNKISPPKKILLTTQSARIKLLRNKEPKIGQLHFKEPLGDNNLADKFEKLWKNMTCPSIVFSCLFRQYIASDSLQTGPQLCSLSASHGFQFLYCHRGTVTKETKREKERENPSTKSQKVNNCTR